MLPALSSEEQLSRAQLKRALEALLPAFSLSQARLGREAVGDLEIKILTSLIHALEPGMDESCLRQALPDFYSPMFGRDREALLGMEVQGMVQAGTAAHIHSLHMKVFSTMRPPSKRGLWERLHHFWPRLSSDR